MEWLLGLGHENNASSTLLAGTPAFGAQTSHGESLNTLRLPCCEKARANGEAIYRCSSWFQVKVSINCQTHERRHLLMNAQPNHQVTTSILFLGGPQRISQSSLCLFLTVITRTFLLSFPSCLWCCLCPYSHSHFKVFVKKEWFQSFQYIPVLVKTQCWGRKRTTFPIFSFTLSLGLQGSSGVPKPLLSSWPFNNSYIVLTLVKLLIKAF